MSVTIRLALSTLFIIGIDGARILAYYPTPSISHQVVFRHLTLELIKRGHELVVITTDPIFPEKETPANLTEINVHDISYNEWKVEVLLPVLEIQGKSAEFQKTFAHIYKLTVDLIVMQLSLPEVQAIINDKTQKFDLLILEAYIDATLGLSHVFKAPVIQFSSLAAACNSLETTGSPMHPFLYPTFLHTRIYNLTIWEKWSQFRSFVDHLLMLKETGEYAHTVLKDVLGSDLPPIDELRKNVDFLFINVHPIWDFNRPVSPNVINLGGIHQIPEKELPKDLKDYLDSSKNGVIYVSFGSNADPAMLPSHKIQMMINVLSKLPYDVLWKWNTDELPGKTDNIRISKWFPQPDLLKHPKIKLFITQGGMQSTDEAINAGVPLIGIPMFGDQWFNVEQYVHLNIGLYVDMEVITEEKLRAAIEEILNNDSYRQNINRLRAIYRDQPQSPLERAVWWTEYVIRHGGAKHLRSPAANISWTEYFELELVFYLLAIVSSVIIALVFVTCKLYKLMFGYRTVQKVKKS